MCFDFHRISCSENNKIRCFLVLRRDLQAKGTGPSAKGHSCGMDERLDITGCTEAFLDGPYDIGYSRIERYMDTDHDTRERGNNVKGENVYGIKAQAMSINSHRALKSEIVDEGIRICMK